MIFDKTGEGMDGFFVAGWSPNPIYLLKGKKPLPTPKQPEPAVVINLKARIKSVLDHLGLEKDSSL